MRESTGIQATGLAVVNPEINCPGCSSVLELAIVLTEDADWHCACGCLSFRHFHQIPDHPVPIYRSTEAVGRVSVDTLKMTAMRVRSLCTGSGSSVVLSETRRG